MTLYLLIIGICFGVFLLGFFSGYSIATHIWGKLFERHEQSESTASYGKYVPDGTNP